MKYQLSFEPELFAGNTEFEEFENRDSEAFEQWQGQNTSNSPQYVRWIQGSLNRILGLRLKIDGVIGPKTRSAIRSFQRQQGLTASGVVTPQTELALRNYLVPGFQERPPGMTVRTCLKKGKMLTLDDYWKDVDEIHSGQESAYKEIVDIIADSFGPRCPSVLSIKLIGHASQDGPRDYNFDLAKRRATKLANKLKVDVPKEVAVRKSSTSSIKAAERIRYITCTKGPDDPIEPCGSSCTEAQHRRNRRVELVLNLVGEYQDNQC